MDKIKHCYLFWYMFSATMGTLSNAFLYTIVHMYVSYPARWMSNLFNPLCLLFGGLLGIVLLGLGRRTALIAANLLLILSSIGASFKTSFLIYIVTPLTSVTFSFNYQIVLLFCKEIPPFQLNGLPIVLLNAFEFLGYTLSLLCIYACRFVLHINPYANDNDMPRLVIVLLGCIPAVIQILLLLFVYKLEPPGYSMDQRSEEEAFMALKEIYSDDAGLREEMEKLTAMRDARRHSVVSWATAICGEKWRSPLLLCIGLLLLNFTSGYYSYALPTTFLKGERSSLHMIFSEGYFFCVISLFGLVIDRYPVHKLMEFGAVAAAVVNLGCTVLHGCYLRYGVGEMVLCACCIVESAIHMTFIVIPTYKFAVANLLDKTLLVGVVVQFLGFVFYAYPLAIVDPKNHKTAGFWMQTVYTAVSVGVYFLISRYMHRYEGRRHSSATLWRPQTELASKEFSDSENTASTYMHVN